MQSISNNKEDEFKNLGRITYLGFMFLFLSSGYYPV